MPAIIQIAGAVSVTIGVGLLNIPAGFIVGGILAVVFGVALERNAK